jgi:Protein of unknown function (DUF2510)
MNAPMTPQPGWYPDPAGGSGQRYWDGNQWLNVPQQPVAVSDGITKTDLKKWASYGVAGYAALFGVFSIPVNIFCGAGAGLGVPALFLGWLGNRSATDPVARKLAKTGLICGGIGTAISIIIFAVLVL